jgi:hypothetical protein
MARPQQLDIQKILAEDFASKAETALELNVDVRTVDRWIANGTAPPVTMIRNKAFFERRDLAEFKRQRERKKKAARQ